LGWALVGVFERRTWGLININYLLILDSIVKRYDNKEM
jgi:hypothetical protein